MRRDSRLTPLLYSALGGLITGAVVLAGVAIADQDPGTDGVPRVLPYRGTLEQDGAPFDGGLTMTFRLHDEADTLVFEEAQQVEVYQGRFSVLLGSTGEQAVQTLGLAVSNADELYLSIGLTQGDGPEVPLGNRQRFLPVPYALWSTASTDFSVGRNLSVAGHAEAGTLGVSGQASVATLGVLEGAEIGGDLHADGAASTGGNLTVGGGVLVGGRHIEFGAIDELTDGGIALSNGGGDILVINNDGGFRDTWVEGDTFTLVAPTLRFRDDGAYPEALTLREDTLWLNRNGRITQRTRVDGRLMVAGPLHSKGNELVFAEQSDSDNAGGIAYRGDDDTLIINRSGGFAGGTRIDGHLHVDGELRITSDDDETGAALRVERVGGVMGGNFTRVRLNPDDAFDGVEVTGLLQASDGALIGGPMIMWSSKAGGYVTLADWFNRHCRLYLGWSNNNGETPDKWGWTEGANHGCNVDNSEDSVCAAGPDGRFTWVSVNADGDMDGQDDMYVGFVCED